MLTLPPAYGLGRGRRIILHGAGEESSYRFNPKSLASVKDFFRGWVYPVLRRLELVRKAMKANVDELLHGNWAQDDSVGYYFNESNSYGEWRLE